MLIAPKPDRVATVTEVGEAVKELSTSGFVADNDPVWTEVTIEDQARPGKTQTVRVPITNLSVGRGALQTVWRLDGDTTLATEIPVGP